MTSRRTVETLLAHAARTAGGSSSTALCTKGVNISLGLRWSAQTGTSPTMACTVKWSFDNTNWMNLTSDDFTSVTTGSGNQMKSIPVRAPYMRVDYSFGGTATPGYTFSILSYITE